MRFIGLWIILITLASTCGPAKVIEFVNSDMDFSDYKSYRLINFKSENKDYSQEGLHLFDQIEKEIELNMKLKNFTSDRNNPDLIVRYELMSTTTTETQRNYNYYYDPYYYYTPPAQSKNYTDAILLIEFRDKSRKKLVWQASLDLRFGKKTTADLAIKQAVDRIFETYPYEAGSNEKIVKEK
ncbi:DUF4136 domain-containing protein [Reichenbachiella ulvae]|uniref:DUF4136 domain-containing protein n=1 Tax=Reichenbachiella ulvae TaxID=2980104 RepID=A0ABT3CRW5_9BACT|nr:DUF4136 domain-containing protein [Reichenbachiella ulvae]MCV9386455.1 DUF4136 domain-containing protein [Reichenbachiella ulvae]